MLHSSTAADAEEYLKHVVERIYVKNNVLEKRENTSDALHTHTPHIVLPNTYITSPTLDQPLAISYLSHKHISTLTKSRPTSHPNAF